MCFDLLKI